MVQSLEVNGVVIGPEVPLPFGNFELVEFDIPRKLTEDGKIEIVLKAENQEFPVAGLCAIWLMRKDKMPWKLLPS